MKLSRETTKAKKNNTRARMTKRLCRNVRLDLQGRQVTSYFWERMIIYISEMLLIYLVVFPNNDMETIYADISSNYLNFEIIIIYLRCKFRFKSIQ